MAQLTTEIIKDVDIRIQKFNNVNANATSAVKAGRKRILRYSKPKNITPPGLKAIKQVELYKKWGPVVPEEYRDEICPKPSDYILELVKKGRSQKNALKKAPNKKAQKKKTLKNIKK